MEFLRVIKDWLEIKPQALQANKGTLAKIKQLFYRKESASPVKHESPRLQYQFLF